LAQFVFETVKEKPLDRKAYFFKLYDECLGVIASQKSPGDA
jgi:hypothetical protein